MNKNDNSKSQKTRRLAPIIASRFFRLSVLVLVLLFLAACHLTPITTPGEPSTQTSTSPGTGSPATSETDVTPSPSSTETADTTTTPVTPGATGTTTPTPTLKPGTTATPTVTRRPTTPPTAAPTAPPTATPTTAAAGSFPYKNYGAFFHNEYGGNSVITQNEGGTILVDTGSAPNGVVLVNVSEAIIPYSLRCKIIVLCGSKSYQYDFQKRNQYMGIPLNMGDGEYILKVYQQIEGTSYAEVMACTFTVALSSSLKPYTAASQMADFYTSSACVAKANSLCGGSSTTDGKVSAVYEWIAANIDYDTALANSITSGQVTAYVPDAENTYNTRKGICFDYASLMCAMLRSQGIPTRLAVGSTPLGYHAWNEVYYKGTGWVVVSSFQWEYIDGSGWVMLDTTFAASGMSPSSIKNTTHTKQKTY